MSKLKESIITENDGNLMSYEERLEEYRVAFEGKNGPIEINDVKFYTFEQLKEALDKEEIEDITPEALDEKP